MESHASQGMQRQMHVGHMASHVSICMPMEKSIKGEGNQFVDERNQNERKEKKFRSKKEIERGRGGKEIGVPTVGTHWTKK